MAKKPMWIIKRIQKYLAEGYEVILRKDSDGAHQVSYSRVTRIEGTHLRRTMFEAFSVAETYDYKVGKYTVSWIEDNDRVSFFWKGKSLSPRVNSVDEDIDREDSEELEDYINDDDEDDCCDCCEQVPTCVRPTYNEPSPRNKRLKRIVL